MQRRIFGGFWLETFQSFRGDLNENKSPLNPVLSKVNMGPVFEVALDYHSLRDNPRFKLDGWETRDEIEQVDRSIGGVFGVGGSSAQRISR